MSARDAESSPAAFFAQALEARYAADPALPVVEQALGSGGPPSVVASRRMRAMMLLLDIDEARAASRAASPALQAVLAASPYDSVDDALAELREILGWPSHHRGPSDIDDSVRVVLADLDAELPGGR